MTAIEQALEQRVELLEDDLAKAHTELENAEAHIEEMQDALVVPTQALHSLHEQAHGPVPWTTCQLPPCRHIGERVHGPAVAS